MLHLRQLILLCVFFAFGIFSCDAQVFVGMSSALNFSRVRFDDDDFQESFKAKEKFRAGYAVSGVADIYFGEVLSLMVEASYTTKGFAYRQTYSQGFKRFNFAELLLAGKIDLNPDAKLAVFSVYLAPYAAYWLSGIKQHSDYKTGVIYETDIKLKSDTSFAYNRYDAGIAGGVDCRLRASKTFYVALGLRTEYGMLSSDKERVLGWKNRNIAINLKFLLKIKK